MGYGGTQGWKFNDEMDWAAESVEGGKAAPPGLYDVKVVSAKPKTAKTDKPMIEVKLQITGAAEEANNETIGWFVYDNWVIAKGAGFRVKNFCMVANIDPPKSQNFDVIAKFCEEVEGTEVPVVLNQRKFEDRVRANVQYYGDEPPKDEQNGEAQARGRGASRTRTTRRAGR